MEFLAPSTGPSKGGHRIRFGLWPSRTNEAPESASDPAVKAVPGGPWRTVTARRTVKASKVPAITVQRAIADVRAQHPFPDYLDNTAEAAESIAGLILSTVAPGRLLDIGCGGLDKTAVLHRLGFAVCGEDDYGDLWHRQDDGFHRLLRFAQDLGIQVYVKDVHETASPWEPESFDVVTAMDVIEHLHGSPRELLNHAGQCLKVGGVVVVTMPNAVNLRKRLAVVSGRTNYPTAASMYNNLGEWRGHVREYTLAETRQILEWSNFTVVRAETFHGMLVRRIRNPAARLAYRMVCELVPTLRDSLFVVGRKPEGWQPALASPAESWHEAEGRTGPARQGTVEKRPFPDTC